MNQLIETNKQVSESMPVHPGLSAPVLIVFRVTQQPDYILPKSGQHEDFQLHLHDLLFLEKLAGATNAKVAPPFNANQIKLLDALHCRSLLQEQKSPLSSEPAEDENETFVMGEDVPHTGRLALIRPFVVRLDGNGYCYLDHDARKVIRMNAAELAAAKVFGRPRTIDEGYELQRTRFQQHALSRELYHALVSRLLRSGLLQIAEHVTLSASLKAKEFTDVQDVQNKRSFFVQKSLEQAEHEEQRQQSLTGKRRIKVVPVQTDIQPVLSLGLLMSYAMAHDNGKLLAKYQFVADWCNLTVPALKGDEAPAIFLFSNYIWSSTKNMDLSRRAKLANPRHLCIHGGPDTPKYEADVRRYLELNTHIDVIVHGEGELTLAEILDTLNDEMLGVDRDLSALQHVTGITYRDGNRIITTPDRERISDLNMIPSPYANGLFDNIGNFPILIQTIETNRGCPFGCTFCDWGSATLSKIRQFDLDRVFSDLEWCAKNKVSTVFNTDSNFGVFERDVEIAQKIVELKEKYGYPKIFESSYAKNQVKNLKRIIQILASGGVVSTGTLSLQSVSPDTLKAIKRSNIKVSKYDELAAEFRRAKLPLIVEMMMGLPGSTLASFDGDLQQAIDREVQARVNPTEVLVNSPMNEPSYRREHNINISRPIEDDWKSENGTVRPAKPLITSTSTFSTSDYLEMERGRLLFLLMENYGVLRQVARYVRHETGTKEMAFYRQLDRKVRSEPNIWPTINFVLNNLGELMIPPGSWRIFIDEIRSYLVNELSIPADDALETVLQVQHALLPSRERVFPHEIQISKNYTEWYKSMIESKQLSWKDDWTSAVNPLRTFSQSVSFIVEDPQQLTSLGFGTPFDGDPDADWEFESPVARPLRFRRIAQAS